MTHIIAGRFQEQQQVQQAFSQLTAMGFAREEMTSFYLNPPGQHDSYPIGGDRDDSPGAKDAANGVTTGAATGGVVGAVIGSIGIPLTGPISTALGGLVGAHIGSLVGSLSQMKEKGDGNEDAENAHAVRKSGMIVAVSVKLPANEEAVAALLKGVGADHIEIGEGNIVAGHWDDFDPLKPPTFVKTGNEQPGDISLAQNTVSAVPSAPAVVIPKV
ncbi:hypothetical protein [Undibacterium sp. TJN19]|uniref:hypothetical protein n=1 Tax=Undibacterium sp. TJN19 TaxID=3413055 RepID=UPI003BF1178F